MKISNARVYGINDIQMCVSLKSRCLLGDLFSYCICDRKGITSPRSTTLLKRQRNCTGFDYDL